MKSVQQDYKTIRSQIGSFYKARVRMAGNEYGINNLQKIQIDSALFDGSGPQIGNAYSTQCELWLTESSANIPRMAPFYVDVRIFSADGNSYSQDWLPMGTFYIDTRQEDDSGGLKIQAFDGMLKLEKNWTNIVPGSAQFPMSARDWATMIQSADLAVFEDLTTLSNDVKFIGLNTASTIRDVLKSIAAAHGGNWMMTTDGKLRLVQFVNPIPITTQATTNNYVWLGTAASDFQHSPPIDAISKVHLESESGAIVEAGVQGGYQLNGNCEFASTVDLADLCLARTEDYIYKPFSVSRAVLDPISELGDEVAIDGQGYQIMRLSWTLGPLITADVSADYDQEVEHEYPVPSASAKSMRKTLSETDKRYLTEAKFATEISQTDSAVHIAAEAVFPTYYFLDQQIQALQDQIDGNIETWSGSYKPTGNNYPANGWTSITDKSEHVGDLFFVNSDAQIPEAGQYFRWEENNGTYSWQLLSDSALTEALNKAAAAMAAAEDADATAHSKGRIWLRQPTPPYDYGDLWFTSEIPGTADIKTCVKEGGRQTGSFVDADWTKLNKYTDDSALINFITNTYTPAVESIQNQVDRKAETYYQDYDPAVNWTACVVGVAVVGTDSATVGVRGGADHEHDLWYNTSTNTTWYYNGSFWEQQDVPQEVFDKIDGKAAVYVTQPEPPYNERDLWFNAQTQELLTCVHGRESGESFLEADWEKKNKYTDDTAALEVAQALTEFRSDFSVETTQIRAEVSKRVIKDKSDTKSSFGWTLTDSAHTWYANDEKVMEIKQTGLEVEGKITATSGYIGTANAGFEITSSAIKNGMTSLGDTTNNGVYFGTNGIALGAGKFKVTSAGSVTAKDIAVTGGTIKLGDITGYSDTSHDGVYIGSSGITLGKGVFKVSNAGAVTASNLSLTGGTIKLGNITGYSDTSHDGVYIGSNGITLGKGVFKVSDAGAVTAKNLSLTGGQITIKNGNTTIFGVSSGGALTANFSGGSLNIGDKIKFTNGTATIGGFTIGTDSIYSNNKSTDGSTRAGVRLSATGIRLGTNFSVDDDGNLYANDAHLSGTLTIGGNAAITQLDLYNAIYQSSQNYRRWNSTATSYSNATTTGSSSIPNYFRARDITATRYMTASDYYVQVDTENSYRLKGHYHSISVNQTTGKVTIGGPYNAASAPFFNIADTAFYKDGVSAVKVDTVTSTSYSTTADHSASISGNKVRRSGDMVYGRLSLELSNDKTETLYVGMESPDSGGVDINDVTIRSATPGTYSQTATARVDFESGKVRYLGDFVTGRADLTLGVAGGASVARSLYIEMPIEGGGYTDQEKTITSNGTYTPESNIRWSVVTVNVPSGGIGELDVDRVYDAITGEIHGPYHFQGTKYVDVNIFNNGSVVTAKKLVVNDWPDGAYVTDVVNYAGDLHTGPYGSKELDLTTRVYYSDGDFRDFASSVTFYMQ